jgi:hypothetical protein
MIVDKHKTVTDTNVGDCLAEYAESGRTNMGFRQTLKEGWLQEELQIALREADRWPSEIRQSHRTLDNADKGLKHPSNKPSTALRSSTIRRTA